MEKKYSISLTENELLTLLMGLRYLYLFHPGYPEVNADYKKDFKQLSDKFYSALEQTNFFDEMSMS